MPIMFFKIKNIISAFARWKHPSVKTIDVVNKIEDGELKEKILQLINADIDYIKDFHADQHQRLHFAIIKLSIDKKYGFEYAKDLIYYDFRDLLMNAGFGHDVYKHLYWADDFVHK